MGVKKVNKDFLWKYFETEKPCFVLFLRGRRAVLKLAHSNSSPRRFSMAFRALLVLRLRTANLLLAATLSFFDSNNFHSLAHTNNIYFNFSCFSKKGESNYHCQL